jgi:hypothetical protein
MYSNFTRFYHFIFILAENCAICFHNLHIGNTLLGFFSALIESFMVQMGECFRAVYFCDVESVLEALNQSICSRPLSRGSKNFLFGRLLRICGTVKYYTEPSSAGLHKIFGRLREFPPTLSMRRIQLLFTSVQTTEILLATRQPPHTQKPPQSIAHRISWRDTEIMSP